MSALFAAMDASTPADPPFHEAVAAAVERYCLGLLVEEIGEALEQAGKAVRFGLDTAPTRNTAMARDDLTVELGDVLAAVEFACLHGVLDRAGIEAARDRKLAKLCDPANRDGLGRPLAPQPIALGDREDRLSDVDHVLCLVERGYAVAVLHKGRNEFTFNDLPAIRARLAGRTLVEARHDGEPDLFVRSRAAGDLCTLVFSRAGGELSVAVNRLGAACVTAALKTSFPPPGDA